MKLILDIVGERVTVRQAVFSMRAAQLLRAHPGGTWHAADTTWHFPISEALPLVRHLTGAELAITPAARAVLQAARDALPKPPVVDVLDYQFKTTPFLHQIDAFAAARKSPYHALLMEMGTGKTKVAIDVASYFEQQTRISRLLVVAPKALLYNWEREIGIHSPLPPDQRRVVVATGTGAQKSKAIQAAREAWCLITNYNTFLSHEDELASWCAEGRTGLVADEATAVKNPAGKIFKAVERVRWVCVMCNILTGTPVTQSPLDVYALFRLLHPDILKHKTFTSFKAEYAISVKLQGIPVPVIRGYRNLDRLANLIKPYSSRVLKVDCLDLPEKIYKVVELPMGPRQAELYRQMKDEAVVDVSPDMPPLAAPIVLTRIMRLQQISSGFLPVIDQFGLEVGHRDIEDAPKIDAAVELVGQALESKQKTIVWCRFTWEVLHLEAALSKLTKVVTYHGATSAIDRQKAVDAIQAGDAQVFIGQIQTGGMGITLTAVSMVVYYSNTFSLSDRLQSEDRAHRIGQTKSVLYVDLVCNGTVDRLVLRAHREKKDLADLVTGDNMKSLIGDSNG